MKFRGEGFYRDDEFPHTFLMSFVGSTGDMRYWTNIIQWLTVIMLYLINP